MKTAIIVYSFTHNNQILAGEILTRTGGTLFNIEERSSRSKLTIFLDMFFNRIPKIRDYQHMSEGFDHYILISPIWGGRIATPLKAFIIEERSKIKSYSFITICGSDSEAQRAKIEMELTGLFSLKPAKVTELSLAALNGDQIRDLLALRISQDQLKFFENKISEFVNGIGVLTPVVSD